MTTLARLGLARLGLVGLLLSTAAAAQHPIYTVHGDSTYDFFGTSVDTIGDVDGDGKAEVIVGSFRDSAPGKQYSGSVRCIDSSGASLWTAYGDVFDDGLGEIVRATGDVDGDGVPDACAMARANGDGFFLAYVKVFDGLTGAVKYTLGPSDSFRGPCAGAGDMNGDGFVDVLTATASSFLGQVRCHSGTDGAVLFALDSGMLPFGWDYAVAIDGVGDVDADGTPDLALGIQSYIGRVRIHSGATQALLYEVVDPSHSSRFGISVARTGDVNQDGHDDVLVGAPETDQMPFQEGAAYLWSGLDGALLAKFSAPYQWGKLGLSVSGLGDVNGDGYPDLAAGAPFSQADFVNQWGAARVYSGRNYKPLFSLYGLAAGDQFGEVGGGGDIDGDGLADLVVGAPRADIGSVLSGTVSVWNGIAIGVSHYGSGTPGCGGTQWLGTNTTPKVGQEDFEIVGSGFQPGIPGLLALSTAQDALGSDVLGLGVLVHVGLPPLGVLFTRPINVDVHGSARARISIPPDASLAGSVLFAQGFSAWVSSCAALSPSGLSSSVGLELVVQP